jgi:hypothetical protein
MLIRQQNPQHGLRLKQPMFFIFLHRVEDIRNFCDALTKRVCCSLAENVVTLSA